jgi:hypothetical protein
MGRSKAKPGKRRSAKPKAKAAPINPPAPENAWDRQPGESAPAFRAFREYLFLGGERSTRRVAQGLDKSHTLIGKWSSKHRWVARVAAFEAEAAHRQDEEALDVLAERSRRQAEITQSTLEAMAAPSAELIRRLGTKTGQAELRKMSMEQLVPLAATTARAIPRVVQTERLARGQSTSNVGGHKGGPIETDERGRSSAERAAAEQRAAEMPTEALDQFLLGADTARRLDSKPKKAKAEK